MKGTLEGDFSRWLSEPEQDYSAVLLQQGRVLLDSDWNAQVDLLARRLRARTRDLVGPHGAPADSPGFEIRARSLLAFDDRACYLTLGGEDFELLADLPGFTFEAWLSYRAEGRRSTLLSRYLRRPGESSFRLHSRLVVLEDGRLALLSADGEGGDRGGGGELVAERPLVFGRFVHVALVHTEDRTALYLDGTRVARSDRGLYLGRGETALVFGATLRDDEPRETFEGLLVEARLWGEALEADRIRGRRRDLPAEPGAPLLGHWRPGPGDHLELEETGGRSAPWRLGGGRPERAPRRTLAQLLVGEGRFYADGILCRNPRTVPLTRQPDLPGARLPSSRPGDLLLVYLDVWERTVTALEDPRIREVALGGPDTTVRSRVVSQVKTLHLPGAAGEGGPEGRGPDPGAFEERWRSFLEQSRRHGRLRARRSPSAGTLGNLLYRVQVHRGSAQPEDGDGSPTFKWSRQNGSVVYPIARLEPGSRVVELESGDGDCLDLSAGDRVEIFDSASVLRGEPGELFRVDRVDTEDLRVTLDGAPEIGHDPAEHPGLRRWDQKPRQDRDLKGGAVPLVTGEWLPLESGVEVYFEGDGPYRPGDYWLLPARTATGGVEWPLEEPEGERAKDGEEGPAREGAGDAGRRPAALPPRGVEHHYAPLAVVAFGPLGYRLVDARPIFQPLTTGAVSKAGDTMTGPLVIRSDLAVEGSGPQDPGVVEAGLLRGLLDTPGAVDTPQLRDASVTLGKLAPELGTVPPGYLILGESPEPPSGYRSTGLSLAVSEEERRWSERSPLPRPDPGPLRGAVVEGRLYIVFESGELWEYEPAEDRWCPRSPNPDPTEDFAVAAAEGKLYAVGGSTAGGRKSRGTQEYDPATDRWSTRAKLPTPRSHLGLAELEGRLYAVGGLRRTWLGERVSRRVEELDPRINRWRRRASLPRARHSPGVGSNAGRLHVFGGARKVLFGLWVEGLTNDHDTYQPASDRWQRGAAPLPTPRLAPAVARVGDRLYAVGGESLFGVLGDCEEYDPEIDRWRRRPPLSPAPGRLAVGAVGGRLLAVGGPGSGDPASRGSVPTRELGVAQRLHLFRKLAEGEEPEGGEPWPSSATASPDRKVPDETPGHAGDAGYDGRNGSETEETDGGDGRDGESREDWQDRELEELGRLSDPEEGGSR